MKKSIGHSFIQYLNIGFFVSGRVVAVVAVVLNLLIFSKQLFLVKNQAAWGTAMKAAFAVALVNLLLSIPVFLRAAKLECNIPRIKNIGQYLLVEYFAMIALFVLTTPFFYIHTGGIGITSWEGDPWWVFAYKITGLITWCAGLESLFQVFMWAPGSNTGKKRKKKRKDASEQTEERDGSE